MEKKPEPQRKKVLSLWNNETREIFGQLMEVTAEQLAVSTWAR